MKIETLGYGIIACGKVSPRHMDAAEQIQGAQLVAIADQNVEKAEQISAERESKPAVYQDYQDLLQDKNVDVVVICLPTQLHAEVTIAAAKAKKHIYCEKAMAPTLKECRDMIAAADDSGVKLTIGQSTRFQACYIQARRVIEAGQIGEVIAIDGAFPSKATLAEDVGADFWRFKAGAQGHGWVVNFGCHYIDTARYLAGEEPRHVSAYVANRFSVGQTPEDQFLITAVCDGQAIITIGQYGTLTHTATRTNGFVIYGTEGVLEAYWRPDGLTLERGADETVPIELDEDLKRDGGWGGAWLRIHREFRQCIEDDTAPPVTGRDGMLNVEWAMAAYLSNERRAWMDLPLGPEFYEYGGPKLYEEVPVAQE